MTVMTSEHLPAESCMRDAVAARDAAFDGRFVYAVVTTGVFCRPSCGSRAARPENLRFFATARAATQAGYRACRRCLPEQVDALADLARYIEEHAERRLTLDQLGRRVGLSGARLQRLFKRTFGVSPKAFQDAARLRRLKSALRDGSDVSDAIYDAGYGSASRVYEAASRNIGMTPGAYRAGGDGETIAYTCRDTPLGTVLMAATSRGVCCVQFGDDPATLAAQLQQEFPRAKLVEAGPSDELDAWADALRAHLQDDAPRPDLPLDLRGTAFQVKVWRFLLGLDRGEVVSYRELARGIGKPRAVRAAASACGANRVAVLVPCHRVLRSDGGLGGYRWGTDVKRALLDAERADAAGSPEGA